MVGTAPRSPRPEGTTAFMGQCSTQRPQFVHSEARIVMAMLKAAQFGGHRKLVGRTQHGAQTSNPLRKNPRFAPGREGLYPIERWNADGVIPAGKLNGCPSPATGPARLHEAGPSLSRTTDASTRSPDRQRQWRPGCLAHARRED